ncbi:MAG: PD-(D/E)XK nuclease family protein [bacterium]|nr:PD-(D/E)XK nuclease family protein [bacterium]
MKKMKSDKEVLQEFLLDIECLDELLPWTKKFNIFDVLKLARTEIRHSNMLAWLFDPNENHGLGSMFLAGFVKRIVENACDNKYDIFSLLLMDFHSFVVYREWKNIDILLVSDEEKKLIAIENKVGSQEHSNQLNRYRHILEETYSDYQRILIYLTPDGTEPSDSENWIISSYIDVVEVLEMICNRIDLKPEIELMICNYIEIIRREVVDDQQLVEVCNKIYNKHKRALDLIFEHRIDGNDRKKDIIIDTLKELENNGDIILRDNIGNNKYFMFSTAKMNEYLGELDNEVSTWGTKSVYYYWVCLEKTYIGCAFELGGVNITDEQRSKMDMIIKMEKPNDNKFDFKFKKIYTEKRNLTEMEEDDEEVVRKVVKEFVMRLMEKEAALLQKLS